MFAVALLPSSLELPSVVLVLGGLASLLSIGVVLHEFGRRRGAVLLLIALLVVPGAAYLRADDDEDFIMQQRCKEYEPWSAIWILQQCWRYEGR